MNFVNPYDLVEIPILEFARNLGIGLLIAVIFAWLVRKSTRLIVDTSQYLPLFTLLIPTMILIITVIKSSIALSLGLVGALSVIRFRTPVKEPEDLAYLFCAISLGIGFGALQFYITTLVFVILMVLIWFFLSKAEQISNNDYNLILEIQDYNDDSINQINKKLKIKSKEAKISKIEKEDGKIFIYYNVLFEKVENLNSLVKEFDADKKIKFTLYENKIID